MTNPIADHPHRGDAPQKSEAEQLAFFDEAMARFREARECCGSVVLHLEVADTLIKLVFAGERLVPLLTPALAHLIVTPEREADITFSLWDSHSTGVAMISPPCPWECFTDRGDIWGMSSRRVRSAFHWIECSLNLMDVQRREALFWVQSDSGLPFWTKASPLRTLFHWWMEENGHQLLHAAAVGDENGALLITGKGGTGKSTSALSCLNAGMQYVADDYLIVRRHPAPSAVSLYSTAKLEGDQVGRFPNLRHLVTNEQYLDSQKAVIHLFPERQEQIAKSLPLVAVATPTFRSGADTTFKPLPRSSLQRAAAFTTMTQLPHAGKEMHAFIEQLVGELPSLTLSLGNDISGVPGAIKALLALPPAEIARIATPPVDEITPAEQPLITVVIPIYNGASFIGDAVRCVIKQQYAPIDIIIVDDGSTDDIDTAVKQLPADVRFFRQENNGPAAARNRGIRDAAGELIAFLDVDDLWPERNLQFLVEHLHRNPAVDVVHGRAQLMRYGAGEDGGEFVGNPGETFGSYIGAGLYRRRVFETVGLFDPDLRFGEDVDWFNRARERQASIDKIDEVTLHVRRHDGNMTRGKTLVEMSLLRVFKKALDRRRTDALMNEAGAPT